MAKNQKLVSKLTPKNFLIAHLKVARHSHRKVLGGDETVEHGRGIEYLGLGKVH